MGSAMMEKHSYVYILTNRPYGTLYVGSTTDLLKRVWQHREGVFDGFTKQYRLTHLVWYEVHTYIMEAARREKLIKRWNRDWKVNLVQKMNPDWRDLYADITA
ncbi:GIY-YIG nuclease family protein [Massilia sp. 2TAF26]|uniref:GIY-YIG nuclease family protein n=1 Tax=Massilia sp. 2TAF26 TaxID=3233012 RepID=UPI003F9E1175